MRRQANLHWMLVAVPLLCLVLPAGVHASISVSIDLADDGLSATTDLFSWAGTVAPWSMDFAGGLWDITAAGSASDWQQMDDGFTYWWEVAVPGTFHVQSGADWLSGQGTFSALIFAADEFYTSIDPFGPHLMALGEWDGVFTGGSLPGQPPIVGGTFSMFPTMLDGFTLTLDGGVPVADGEAAFFLPGGVTGEAQPTPEPATWVLLVAGMGIVGLAKRRKR